MTVTQDITRVIGSDVVKVGERAAALTGEIHEPVYVWTREDISNAVNNGADLVADELTGSERDTDLMNMVVNAVMTLLDNPHYTLDEVITECYDEDPEEVRSWWSGW
ncbi:hypothetical protein AB0O76_40495 [Streptomyces sp. NPDC086554]|uniref:hypothetical protein n=1 Tax=Streptomyces sp. NPDC086554 TaxID=3154864 RepID=UPI00341C4FCF